MGCTNTQTSTCTQSRNCGSGYLTIIVLYILLAIILGSIIC